MFRHSRYPPRLGGDIVSPDEELICAIMRGETLRWPTSAEVASEGQFVDVCARHGVAPLVFRQLSENTRWEGWPRGIRSRLEGLALRQRAVEFLFEVELIHVLEALAAHEVRPILVKGSGLAYTHYPDLGLRPRADTDLLIQKTDIRVTEEVLANLGFVRLNMVTGNLIMQQCTYAKEDVHGLRHLYDVHWKLSNVLRFADILSHSELIRSAIPIAALGKNACTLNPVHALLLACLHRVAHHADCNYLLWLYDIHLLVSHMTVDERERFAGLVRDKQLGTICARSLKLAQKCFGTGLPRNFIEILERDDGGGFDRPAARFLKPYQRRIDVVLSDLQALSNWRDKLCLLKEHVFPSADYMLNRYSTTNRAFLPVLYLDRVLHGARKLWTRN